MTHTRKVTVNPRLRKSQDENGDIILFARNYRLELFDNPIPAATAIPNNSFSTVNTINVSSSATLFPPVSVIKPDSDALSSTMAIVLPEKKEEPKKEDKCCLIM